MVLIPTVGQFSKVGGVSKVKVVWGDFGPPVMVDGPLTLHYFGRKLVPGRGIRSRPGGNPFFHPCNICQKPVCQITTQM